MPILRRGSAAIAGAPIVLAALSLFPTACDHESPVRGAEADALAALAVRADKLADDDAFSGAVLVAREGRTLFNRAYGLADRKRRIPNTVRTRFRIGSMNMADYPNREVAAKVTIHQLLTHTGGTGEISWADFQAHRKALRTSADYVKRYGERGLEFEPGSRWAYSSWGFLLLGVVIEKVTGQRYYDYVQAHVYAPAGMIRSGSLPEDRAVARCSATSCSPPPPRSC